MTGQDHDPVKDVVLLMMVRFMSDDDFLRLCGKARKDANTEVSEPNIVPFSPFRSLPVPSSPFVCDCCEARIEPSRETDAFAAATGLPACKACVDALLAAYFGPDEGASRITRSALSLMAAANA